MKPLKNKVAKFFTFRQNNSGGSFDYEPERGITVTVIIQATDAQDANARAESIGLYFDGEGDCSCCGDRWCSAWRDEDGTDIPTMGYGPDENGVYTHIKDEGPSIASSLYSHMEYPVIVHYLNGSMVGYRQGEPRMLRDATQASL